MTKLQAEIIIALAENQLSITETSRKIFLHRNSVSYHIRKITKNTGKNPLDFYDMCDLLPLARQVFNGGAVTNEQTWNAIAAIGRQTHGDLP